MLLWKKTGLMAAIGGFVAVMLAMPVQAQTYGESYESESNYIDFEVEDLCQRLSRKLSSVKLNDCLGADLQTTSGYSVNGLPITVRKIYPDDEARPRPRVLLMGGVHGDEFSGVSIVFKWLKALERNGTGNFHWHISPTVNPDGLLRRKAQRMNANGVDLNRNFPTHDWDELGHKYWVRRTRRNPRRYPGPESASEPETRWIMEEIENFRPDVVVQIHAPYGIVDFDGKKNPPNRLGRLHLRLLGTYPGSLGNYGNMLNVPVLTIELPSAGVMPSSRETNRIWRDLLKWIDQNIIAGERFVDAADSQR